MSIYIFLNNTKSKELHASFLKTAEDVLKLGLDRKKSEAETAIAIGSENKKHQHH